MPKSYETPTEIPVDAFKQNNILNLQMNNKIHRYINIY